MLRGRVRRRAAAHRRRRMPCLSPVLTDFPEISRKFEGLRLELVSRNLALGQQKSGPKAKHSQTLPRARARKSARRTTTILHVQSCTVRARARRARSIISDQRPDAHGARTRARAKPQTEPKRRPQGKRTRVYTDSRFQFHTATRTGHKFQV